MGLRVPVSAESGVPDGGTTDQVLTKLSDTDGDADWTDPAAGVDLSTDLGPFAAGKGILLTSPDGLTISRVRIDNDGDLVTEDYSAPAGDFDPTGIAGLLAWYDASDLSLSNGDPVAALADLSGNGRNLTQSGAARPTYVAAGIGGLPSMDFNGTGQWLAQSAGDGATPKNIFVVCFSSEATFGDYRGLVTGTSGADNFHAWIVSAGATTRFYSDGATYLDGVSSPTHEAPMNGAAGVVLKTSETAFHTSNIQIGNERDTNRYWLGRIAEVLLFDSVLSEEDRNFITGGLGDKYGIAVTA